MNRRERIVLSLAIVGIIAGEFMLLAPIYPYEARVVDTSIVLPLALKDCDVLVWSAGILARSGWFTVEIETNPSVSSDPVRVSIGPPDDPLVLNETATKIDVTLPIGMTRHGYRVMVENPGTTCDGPYVTFLNGIIEFWHQETRWRGILFAGQRGVNIAVVVYMAGFLGVVDPFRRARRSVDCRISRSTSSALDELPSR